jgi:hypothetical protein
MSRSYIDTIQTIAQGALGAVTFGIYYRVTTDRIMELNHEKIALQYKKIEREHTNGMNELRQTLARIEERRRWWIHP